MGSFAEFGWAWNLKPSAAIVGSPKAAIPSAEFVESFLIFLYGATNVFLEHLGGWGGEWSAGDLEHVSIAVMLFGGGLCGMLVESRTIRDPLTSPTMSLPKMSSTETSVEFWQTPKTYGFSTNPLPGIVILLLGLMMSSYHRSSTIATMLHIQWGTLLMGAALARGVTYPLLHLAPPASYLPSRPPSEFVVAFCFISGGLIFMASNHDMIASMEAHDLDAMFTFTVLMGASTFLMAWTITILAVKGWSVARYRESQLGYSNANWSGSKSIFTLAVQHILFMKIPAHGDKIPGVIQFGFKCNNVVKILSAFLWKFLVRASNN